MAAIRQKIYPLCKISAQTLNICYRPQTLSRLISTSNKNKDTTTIDEAIVSKPKVVEKTKAQVAKNEDWITYGFSFKDEETDRITMHLVMFTSITIVMVGGAFVLAYMPDLRAKDWLRRESFLELNRRERLGLPIINPDLVNPADVILPSDEELGDTEIII